MFKKGKTNSFKLLILIASLMSLFLLAAVSPTLGNDLAVYYKLDQLSGPRWDSHGQVHLTEVADEHLGFRTNGAILKATDHVTTTEQYLHSTYNPAFGIGGDNFGDDFTISLWFRAKAAHQHRIISKGFVTHGVDYELGVDNTNNLYFKYTGDSGTVYTMTTTAEPRNGDWHHIIIKMDSNKNFTMKFDNSIVKATTALEFIKNRNSDFTIGRSSTAVLSPFLCACNIDEVAIFKRATTNEEDTYLYSKPSYEDIIMLSSPYAWTIDLPTGNGIIFMSADAGQVIIATCLLAMLALMLFDQSVKITRIVTKEREDR